MSPDGVNVHTMVINLEVKPLENVGLEKAENS